MTELDKGNFLTKTSLLAGVPPPLCACIAPHLTEVRVSAGEVVFHEGDPGDALYFVVEGELRIEKQGVNLLSLPPFQCVGEFALIDDQPRSATVIAEHNSLLLRWDREHFKRLSLESSEVTQGVWKLLTHRLREDGYRHVLVLIEQERVQQDLRRAREIQLAMLPSADLATPHVRVCGFCRPANYVGGDYFDYRALGSDKVGLIIGDATGHGFYAGLFVAMAKSCFHNQIETDSSPQKVMESMNRTLSLALNANRLMTCCFVALDPVSGTLTYCNAGHPPPYHFRPRAQKIDRLQPTDPLLGLPNFESASFNSSTSEWSSGDVLVLFSDGIIEAQNSKEERFGYKRLEDLVQQNIDNPPSQIGAAILEAVSAHSDQCSQADDITIVVARAL